jgi:hypothetical protein
MGLVRLRVRQGGKWQLYETFDPTAKEFAATASPYEGAARTARQLGECLLGMGEVEAFAVMPAPRRTDSPTVADVIFFGQRGR